MRQSIWPSANSSGINGIQVYPEDSENQNPPPSPKESYTSAIYRPMAKKNSDPGLSSMARRLFKDRRKASDPANNGELAYAGAVRRPRLNSTTFRPPMLAPEQQQQLQLLQQQLQQQQRDQSQRHQLQQQQSLASLETVLPKRKDSVASHHAPIGPEEAELLRSKQRRRVAVSFHHQSGSEASEAEA